MNTKFLSYFATAATVAALIGIAVNAFASALFIVAICSLLVLIAATDYKAAALRWPAMSLTTTPERHPLAA
jgi:hypothetical protein